MNEEKENHNKLEDAIAPSYEEREEFKQKLKDVSYYLIIFIISMLLLFLVPFLNGYVNGDFAMNFPKTTTGWVVWSILHGSQALANVAIFVMFKLQAKVNVKNHPNFIEAENLLLNSSKTKKSLPRSPKTLNKKEYSAKIPKVLISSLTSTIVVSNLILNFDLVTFLSCIVSTITSIIWGWTTMLGNESYWTSEYLAYAKYITGGDQNGN